MRTALLLTAFFAAVLGASMRSHSHAQALDPVRSGLATQIGELTITAVQCNAQSALLQAQVATLQADILRLKDQATPPKATPIAPPAGMPTPPLTSPSPASPPQ